MAAVLSEVMLDQPDRFETELVRQDYLLDVLAVDPALGHALAPGMLPSPRLRHVELIKQSQFHWRSPNQQL